MTFASRIPADRILSGTRLRVLNAILAEPGINLTGIMEAAETGNGNAQFHARVLEHFGFVYTLRSGRHRRHYPATLIEPHEAAADALVRKEPTHTVFGIVANEPGLSQRAITQRVGTGTRQAVAYHLQRLIDAGLVSDRRDGKCKRYRPTPAAEAFEVTA